MYFFHRLLPQIIKLALNLPELVQTPLPVLSRNNAQKISLSQVQIGSLLANAFLCTMPGRCQELPTINFLHLFLACCEEETANSRLKCFLNYFHRICTKSKCFIFIIQIQ